MKFHNCSIKFSINYLLLIPLIPVYAPVICTRAFVKHLLRLLVYRNYTCIFLDIEACIGYLGYGILAYF